MILENEFDEGEPLPELIPDKYCQKCRCELHIAAEFPLCLICGT